MPDPWQATADEVEVIAPASCWVLEDPSVEVIQAQPMTVVGA